MVLDGQIRREHLQLKHISKVLKPTELDLIARLERKNHLIIHLIKLSLAFKYNLPGICNNFNGP